VEKGSPIDLVRISKTRNDRTDGADEQNIGTGDDAPGSVVQRVLTQAVQGRTAAVCVERQLGPVPAGGLRGALFAHLTAHAALRHGHQLQQEVPQLHAQLGRAHGGHQGLDRRRGHTARPLLLAHRRRRH